ncbi:MAG TPA: hypothetical protein VE422_32720 [Terriglobia bacterium]|nr:hypothetical protein [Terriglobia bacterium]
MQEERIKAQRVKGATIIITALGVMLSAGARLVPFRPDISPALIAGILMPLAVVALFMERALEVLLTPWRRSTVDQFEVQMKAAEAAGAPTTDLAEKLTLHKGETRELAFLSGLALGTLVSAAGVRSLQPLIDLQQFTGLSMLQRNALTGIDVVMTASLLAGGSDGLHRIVSIFTTLFDRTKEKVKAA